MHVWNVKQSQLLCVLNRHRAMTVIKDIQVVHHGYALAVRHREGITLWPLSQKLPQLQVRNGSVGISQFLLSADRRHLVYCNHHNQVVKASLVDPAQSAYFSLKRLDVLDVALFGNGDALLKVKLEGGHAESGFPAGHGVVLLDVDTAYKTPREHAHSKSQACGKLSLRTISLAALHELWHSENHGQYVLLTTAEPVSCFSLVCNKGLPFPLVSENGRNLAHEGFYSGRSPDANNDWKGTLLAGTAAGTCFQVDFCFDRASGLSSSTRVTFRLGKPLKSAQTLPTASGQPGPSSQRLGFQKSLDAAVVHDYRRFLRESVEVALVSRGARGLGKPVFGVYAKALDGFDWGEAEFEVNSLNRFSTSNYFRVRRMPEPRVSPECRFFFANSVGVGLVHFDKRSAHTRVTRFFDMDVSRPEALVFSESLQLFLVPVNSAVEIWDRSFSDFVHKLQFDSEVLGLFLCGTNHAPRLLVYNQVEYRELDLLSFEVLRGRKLVARQALAHMHTQAQSGVVVPLDLHSLHPNTRYAFPSFRGGLASVDFVSGGECFDLFAFPFASIEGCFSRYNYRGSIRAFSQHYFESIAQFDFADRVYGPLSPLTMAIYQNDMALLEELLIRFRYPKAVAGYLSPLSFAFAHGFASAVHILCEHLVERDYPVRFSRSDFGHLLNSPLEECHSLLATVFYRLDNNRFPVFLRLKQRAQLIEEEHLVGALCKIRQAESAKAAKFRRSRRDAKSGAKARLTRKTEVNGFEVPFDYCVTPGSPESLRLLKKVAHSRSNDFVVSLWAEVVRAKWRRFYVVLTVKAILFALLLGLAIVHTIVTSAPHSVAKCGFLGLFLAVFTIYAMYTNLEILSFCFFGLKT